MLQRIVLVLAIVVLLSGCSEVKTKQLQQTSEVKRMKALFIIAQEGYHPLEYATPKKILEDGGVEVITASKRTGTCTDKVGGSVEATVSIDDVDVSDYDAVIFIGGPGAVEYQQDVQAHMAAQEAVNRGKLLAAICIAPTILAKAGVLQGKKVTVWNGDGQQVKVLTDNGAQFSDESVMVDGRILTANGPPAAEEFGRRVLELMKG